MNGKHTIGGVAFLTQDERNQILNVWNDTSTPLPEGSVADLFEDQVERSPDAIAIVFEDQMLSYERADRRANQLAHRLIALGIEPENVVALALPRSTEIIIAMLGIVKCGATYLPLDLGYPKYRIEFILRDAAPALVLTTAELSTQLPAGTPYILLDNDCSLIEEFAGGLSATLMNAPRPVWLQGESAAYVMYTSGSTGVPKGVVVTQRGIVRLVCNADYVHLDSQEVVLQMAPFSFDASTFEIWGSLLNGARLVLYRSSVPTLEDLGRCLRSENVTTLWLTAGLFHAMASSHPGDLLGIHQLLAGGDVLAVSDIRKILSLLPECVLINGYGPTEATTFSCAHRLEPDDCLGASAPIGRPISNTRLYVLDTRLDLVPAGVAGDLYIAGAGLGRGYLKRPSLTAERFVADPYGAPGVRMYRTGDVAQWREDGVLEFLGRTDRQIKIRGFRVELGEIEAAIRALSAVKEGAAIALEYCDEKRIIAYASLVEGSDFDGTSIRSALAETLPEYMVPAAVIVMDEIPLTPNGKVDRNALPRPEFGSDQIDKDTPRTTTEELLGRLFGEVLDLTHVGVDSDFFQLGGHSLSGVSLVSRVHSVLGVELGVDVLFESPTPKRLAARLHEGRKGRPTLGRQPRPDRLPLSFAQQRLWFLDRLAGGCSNEYNVPVALRLKGLLDQSALERAINTIVGRHESLRTHFSEIDGQAVQVIEPELHIEIPFEDLSGLPEPERQCRLRAALGSEWLEPFNLMRGPVLRFKVLKTGDAEHVLLRTMHHIVSDGWSQGVFTRELMILYDSYRDGLDNPLKPLAIQYADFALWQRHWLSGDTLATQLSYWKHQLAEMPPPLELPRDRPRLALPHFSAEFCKLVVPAEVIRQIHELGHRSHSTLSMILLTAFSALLSRYTRQYDIVIGTPIANRQDPLLEELIGFFVNTQVMRIRLTHQMTFRELLTEVRTTALGAYRNQDIPFEHLVEELAPRRSLATMPLCQIVFALQNAPWKPQTLKGLAIEPIQSDSPQVRCDLEVHAFEINQEVEMHWLFNRSLFDRWRIEQMGHHYLRLLHAILADPDQRIHRVSLLDAAEKFQLLERFGSAGTPP